MKFKKRPIPENENKYKRYKHILNKATKVAEQDYYEDIFRKNKDNLSKSWKTLKDILNKKRESTKSKVFNHNGKLLTRKMDIANGFNNYFVQTGPTLADNIPVVNRDALSYLGRRNVHTLFLEPVDQMEIGTIIKNLKTSSPGWDHILPKIIKCTVNCCLKPLEHIINLSLITGIVPNQWKRANVIPLYKSDNPKIFNNYRPVSLLPVFSKVMEKVIYARCIKFLDKHSVLYNNQFGFRRNHSTGHALLLLMEKLAIAHENNERTIGLFLDFSKAFDTVNYDILFRKLEHYGFRGTVLNWFKNYLSNRTQSVIYQKYSSVELNLRCGVPQGSVLGPLLFLLYIYDLAYVSNKLSPIMFADDSSFFLNGKDLNEMAAIFNQEMTEIVVWLRSNKLSLNVKKKKIHGVYLSKE